jgi:hypothetical protein
VFFKVSGEVDGDAFCSAGAKAVKSEVKVRGIGSFILALLSSAAIKLIVQAAFAFLVEWFSNLSEEQRLQIARSPRAAFRELTDTGYRANYAKAIRES